MGRAQLAGRQDAEAFEHLRLRLPDVAASMPPHVDPHTLAVHGLLAADRLAQADVFPRVQALGNAGVCDAAHVEELRAAARSLLHALSQWGEAGDRRSSHLASTEASRLRQRGIEALEQLDGDDARLWLDVFRLPSGEVDLVFDLRCIARLYEEHADVLRGRLDTAAEAQAARRAADALERSLWGERAHGEWRQWVSRAFSLTFALYGEVRLIGMAIRLPGGHTLAFPSPAGVARAARRNRSAPSSRSLRAAKPAAPPEVDVIDEDVVDLEPEPEPEVEPDPEPQASGAPASEPESEPASSPAPDSSGPRRRFDRLPAELEVSVFSDSNFYVGFTENLSEGGLFVATYFVRPLGSAVELSVRVPGSDTPIVLRGTVRWLREYSPTSDGHPGMGIQFDALHAKDKALIAAFLAKREPLFYDE
jgi:uncharacterized protein (TIGR02266 family)